MIVVEIELELRRIEVAEDRLDKIRTRVLAEIGRQDGNPQAARRIGRVGKRHLWRGRQRAAECHVLGKQSLARYIRQVVQGKQPVASRLVVPRLRRDKFPVVLHRRRDLSGLLQRLRPAKTRERIFRIGRKRPIVVAERLQRPPHQA